MKIKYLALVASTLFFANAAQAQNTTTSPTGGALPTGVSSVGGVVADLKGLNGNRVVSQLAASALFVGFSYDPATKPGTANGNPLVFGTQTGFNAATLAALGGGITGASFRISLYDGDSQVGNFDYHQDTFQVNGLNFGDFSDVTTYQTDSTGNLIGTNPEVGFGDNLLNTGFFSSTNLVTLAQLYTSLTTNGSLAFAVNDLSPGDNYFDFTQGVDASLINVGTGPVITPPTTGAVPEPASWAMMILGMGVIGYAMRRRVRASEINFNAKIKRIAEGATA